MAQKVAERKRQKTVRQREIIEVLCAFCGGQGLDPFGIMSPRAACQVCGGRGHRTLHQPISGCVFCGGTGVNSRSHLTCITCGGVGKVEMPKNPVTCQDCGGTGRSAFHGSESPLACTRCGGKGII